LVIPSINSSEFNVAANNIRKAEEFSEWIHVDVEDGKFTKHITWGNPEEFESLNTKLNLEVHLMIQEPESEIESWLEVRAKRIIVHLQSIKDPSFILNICGKYGAEAVLSFDPSVPVDAGLPYIRSFDYFQILSVFPGPSGQRFREESIEKITSLRQKAPTATIEVDGGINEDTGRSAKEAGANILVAGHYIFGSPDPKGAYERLSAI